MYHLVLSQTKVQTYETYASLYIFKFNQYSAMQF